MHTCMLVEISWWYRDNVQVLIAVSLSRLNFNLRCEFYNEIKLQ